jgi:tight adherence protein C
MEPNRLAALALALAALAFLLLAALALVRLAAARNGARTLAKALDRRAAAAGAAPVAAATSAAASAGVAARGAEHGGARLDAGAGAAPPPKRFQRLATALSSIGQAGVRWLDTPLGKQIVANEDRRVLDQCGFVDARARGLFLIARLLCAGALPLALGWLARGHVEGSHHVLLVGAAILAGFMLPKVAVQRRAAARRRAVVDELPMLVDLLRLLQGVGLSLDQSLQVMVNDFRGVMRVLSAELEIAQRQFAAGRTRELSLQRLATTFDNEDLRAVVRLLIQVDRHGGAVQEPLKQFGERLRETRRAMLRERIGRMTVKMTGVMILTLLPALLIVTAGPGLLGVTRMLMTTHR